MTAFGPSALTSTLMGAIQAVRARAGQLRHATIGQVPRAAGHDGDETRRADPAAPALKRRSRGSTGAHTWACERGMRRLETTNPVAAPSAASRAALGRT